MSKRIEFYNGWISVSRVEKALWRDDEYTEARVNWSAVGEQDATVAHGMGQALMDAAFFAGSLNRQFLESHDGFALCDDGVFRKPARTKTGATEDTEQ